MKDKIEREISATVQFFIILIIAIVLAFFWMLPSGGSGEFANAINLKEAWKNIAPYVNGVLLVFGGLSILRLALVYLAQKFITKYMKPTSR
jgi:threonine/homoserine/homoserine lactone efflux protein